MRRGPAPRRADVLGATVLALACLAPGGAPAAPPRVTANHEILVGSFGAQQPSVVSFKGIPFAEPPVGERRWQAPQPPRPRRGVQSAQRFAAACFQDSYNSDWYRRVGGAFGADPSTFSDPEFSEDCLYLNVWTPAVGRHARLPVMVWIHGGSNKAGWSYEPNYHGGKLAARGRVVVVTIAYRLGIFGFFGHPQLRGSAAPTNFAVLDQLAALRWVHEHIRGFGGDPDNVTILGESAGASGVGYLAMSPLATGLFRRVISESGGFQLRDDPRPAHAEELGTALTNALPGHPDLAELKRLPAAEVFAAARRTLADHQYQPVVDGVSVTASPASHYREHGIPYDLLIGTNGDENYMYVDDDPASLAATLAGLPQSVRGALAERAAAEPDVRRGHDKASTLVNMACPGYLMAASAVASGRQAWVYRFTRVRPGPGGQRLLAYHGAEIPYVFDTHDFWLSGDATESRLTTAMLRYWTSFARSGSPNGRGLAEWPRFDPAQPQLLELGDRIAPRAAPDHALCRRIAPAVYPGWSG